MQTRTAPWTACMTWRTCLWKTSRGRCVTTWIRCSRADLPPHPDKATCAEMCSERPEHPDPQRSERSGQSRDGCWNPDTPGSRSFRLWHRSQGCGGDGRDRLPVRVAQSRVPHLGSESGMLDIDRRNADRGTVEPGADPGACGGKPFTTMSRLSTRRFGPGSGVGPDHMGAEASSAGPLKASSERH